jgi:hypothetical protein
MNFLTRMKDLAPLFLQLENLEFSGAVLVVPVVVVIAGATQFKNTAAGDRGGFGILAVLCLVYSAWVFR